MKRCHGQPTYIPSICNKANHLLEFLYRNLHNCLPLLKERAYKQIVLPSIEYCSAIWEPHQQSLIHKLDIMQHHVARFVLNKPQRRNRRDSITNMLSSLNWPPLEKCRSHLCLILFFKFLNGIIHIPSLYLPALSPSSITRSNHNQKLMQLYARTDRYHYSFLPRTIPDWNNLGFVDLVNCDLDSLIELFTDVCTLSFLPFMGSANLQIKCTQITINHIQLYSFILKYCAKLM